MSYYAQAHNTRELAQNYQVKYERVIRIVASNLSNPVQQNKKWTVGGDRVIEKEKSGIST